MSNRGRDQERVAKARALEHFMYRIRDTQTPFGNYRVKGLIEEGQYGGVFKAKDEEGRPVAVKLLFNPGSRQDRIRFELEGNALNLVREGRHPNVIRAYETGINEVTQDGILLRIPFIAMEYVEGQTLKHLINGGTSLDKIVGYIKGVAQGLSHIHSFGILHRDIKPANIIVRNGTGVPKILDFGCASFAYGDLANATMIMKIDGTGTKNYMSLEQIKNAIGEDISIDLTVDFYALGLTLYDCIVETADWGEEDTKRLQREPGQLPPLLRKDVLSNFPKPGAVWQKFLIKYQGTMIKLVNPDPKQRFQSADEVVSALEEILNDFDTDKTDSEVLSVGRKTLVVHPSYIINLAKDVPFEKWRDECSKKYPAFILVPDHVQEQIMGFKVAKEEEGCDIIPGIYFTGSREIHIGRTKDHGIRLTGDGAAQLSRVHARIQIGGDNFYLSDCDSLNGTVLNSRQLQRGEVERLTSGDEIAFGN